MYRLPRGAGRARGGKAILGLVLAVAYSLTNVVFVHAAESAFWADRKKAAQRLRTSSSETGYDSPNLTDGQRQLLAQLPGARPMDFRATEPSAASGAVTQASPVGRAFDRADIEHIPSWISSLVLPYAAVRDIHLSSKPGAPLVVHVQDAHGLEDAQRNVAGLIESLRQERGISLVGLEGASGAFALDPYRAFPDPAVTKDIADYFLKEATITGPEYAGLTSSAPPLLWGVEDQGRYEENIRSFRESIANQPAVSAQLKDLTAAADLLKLKVYSPELKEFDRRFAGYQDGREGLGAYVKFLMDSHLGSKTPFPNLRLLLEALAWEDGLDFKRVERDRLHLVETLTRRLPEKVLNHLVQQSLLYRAGRMTYGDYYRFLRALCAQNGISLSDFGSLGDYITYVLVAERINRNDLLDELYRLEAGVQTALAATMPEKRLVEASRDLSLLAKLTSHAMTPADWADFQTNRKRVLSAPLELKVVSLDLPRGESPEIPRRSENFEALLAPFEEFCAYAVGRNNALVDNLLAKMAADKAPAAILVAGGFHTDGLTRVLRGKGASYVVLTPKIEDIPKENAYLDVFARDALPLEKLFEGDKINLLAPQVMGESNLKTTRSHEFRALTILFQWARQTGQITPQEYDDLFSRLPDVEDVELHDNGATIKFKDEESPRVFKWGEGGREVQLGDQEMKISMEEGPLTWAEVRRDVSEILAQVKEKMKESPVSSVIGGASSLALAYWKLTRDAVGTAADSFNRAGLFDLDWQTALIYGAGFLVVGLPLLIRYLRGRGKRDSHTAFVTFPERLEVFDGWLEKQGPAPSGVYVEIGMGVRVGKDEAGRQSVYPPTTVELARRFPGAKIVGVDRFIPAAAVKVGGLWVVFGRDGTPFFFNDKTGNELQQMERRTEESYFVEEKAALLEQAQALLKAAEARRDGRGPLRLEGFHVERDGETLEGDVLLEPFELYVEEHADLKGRAQFLLADARNIPADLLSGAGAQAAASGRIFNVTRHLQPAEAEAFLASSAPLFAEGAELVEGQSMSRGLIFFKYRLRGGRWIMEELWFTSDENTFESIRRREKGRASPAGLSSKGEDLLMRDLHRMGTDILAKIKNPQKQAEWFELMLENRGYVTLGAREGNLVGVSMTRGTGADFVADGHRAAAETREDAASGFKLMSFLSLEKGSQRVPAADMQKLFSDLESLGYEKEAREDIKVVLVEFMQNAARHGAGKIEISWGTDPSSLRLRVRNEGEIPADRMEKVREALAKTVDEEDPTAAFQEDYEMGAGMGLITVNAAARKMAGSLTVDSEKGWTTFTFTAPLPAPVAAGFGIVPAGVDPKELARLQAANRARAVRLRADLDRGKVPEGFKMVRLNLGGKQGYVCLNAEWIEWLQTTHRLTPQDYFEKVVDYRYPYELVRKNPAMKAERDRMWAALTHVREFPQVGSTVQGRPMIYDFLEEAPASAGNHTADGYSFQHAKIARAAAQALTRPQSLSFLLLQDSHELLHEALLRGSTDAEEVALAAEDVKAAGANGLNVARLLEAVESVVNAPASPFFQAAGVVRLSPIPTGEIKPAQPQETPALLQLILTRDYPSERGQGRNAQRFAEMERRFQGSKNVRSADRLYEAASIVRARFLASKTDPMPATLEKFLDQVIRYFENEDFARDTRRGLAPLDPSMERLLSELDHYYLTLAEARRLSEEPGASELLAFNRKLTDGEASTSISLAIDQVFDRFTKNIDPVYSKYSPGTLPNELDGYLKGGWRSLFRTVLAPVAVGLERIGSKRGVFKDVDTGSRELFALHYLRMASLHGHGEAIQAAWRSRLPGARTEARAGLPRMTLDATVATLAGWASWSPDPLVRRLLARLSDLRVEKPFEYDRVLWLLALLLDVRDRRGAVIVLKPNMEDMDEVRILASLDWEGISKGLDEKNFHDRLKEIGLSEEAIKAFDETIGTLNLVVQEARNWTDPAMWEKVSLAKRLLRPAQRFLARHSLWGVGFVEGVGFIGTQGRSWETNLWQSRLSFSLLGAGAAFVWGNVQGLDVLAYVVAPLMLLFALGAAVDQQRFAEDEGHRVLRPSDTVWRYVAVGLFSLVALSVAGASTLGSMALLGWSPALAIPFGVAMGLLADVAVHAGWLRLAEVPATLGDSSRPRSIPPISGMSGFGVGMKGRYFTGMVNLRFRAASKTPPGVAFLTRTMPLAGMKEVRIHLHAGLEEAIRSAPQKGLVTPKDLLDRAMEAAIEMAGEKKLEMLAALQGKDIRLDFPDMAPDISGADNKNDYLYLHSASLTSSGDDRDKKMSAMAWWPLFLAEGLMHLGGLSSPSSDTVARAMAKRGLDPQSLRESMSDLTESVSPFYAKTGVIRGSQSLAAMPAVRLPGAQEAEQPAIPGAPRLPGIPRATLDATAATLVRWGSGAAADDAGLPVFKRWLRSGQRSLAKYPLAAVPLIEETGVVPTDGRPFWKNLLQSRTLTVLLSAAAQAWIQVDPSAGFLLGAGLAVWVVVNSYSFARAHKGSNVGALFLAGVFFNLSAVAASFWVSGSMMFSAVPGLSLVMGGASGLAGYLVSHSLWNGFSSIQATIGSDDDEKGPDFSVVTPSVPAVLPPAAVTPLSSYPSAIPPASSPPSSRPRGPPPAARYSDLQEQEMWNDLGITAALKEGDKDAVLKAFRKMMSEDEATMIPVIDHRLTDGGTSIHLAMEKSFSDFLTNGVFQWARIAPPLADLNSIGGQTMGDEALRLLLSGIKKALASSSGKASATATGESGSYRESTHIVLTGVEEEQIARLLPGVWGSVLGQLIKKMEEDGSDPDGQKAAALGKLRKKIFASHVKFQKVGEAELRERFRERTGMSAGEVRLEDIKGYLSRRPEEREGDYKNMTPEQARTLAQDDYRQDRRLLLAFDVNIDFEAWNDLKRRAIRERSPERRLILARQMANARKLAIDGARELALEADRKTMEAVDAIQKMGNGPRSWIETVAEQMGLAESAAWFLPATLARKAKERLIEENELDVLAELNDTYDQGRGKAISPSEYPSGHIPRPLHMLRQLTSDKSPASLFSLRKALSDYQLAPAEQEEAALARLIQVSQEYRRVKLILLERAYRDIRFSGIRRLSLEEQEDRAKRLGLSPSQDGEKERFEYAFSSGFVYKEDYMQEVSGAAEDGVYERFREHLLATGDAALMGMAREMSENLQVFKKGGGDEITIRAKLDDGVHLVAGEYNGMNAANVQRAQKLKILGEVDTDEEFHGGIEAALQDQTADLIRGGKGTLAGLRLFLNRYIDHVQAHSPDEFHLTVKPDDENRDKEARMPLFRSLNNALYAIGVRKYRVDGKTWKVKSGVDVVPSSLSPVMAKLSVTFTINEEPLPQGADIVKAQGGLMEINSFQKAQRDEAGLSGKVATAMEVMEAEVSRTVQRSSRPPSLADHQVPAEDLTPAGSKPPSHFQSEARTSSPRYGAPAREGVSEPKDILEAVMKDTPAQVPLGDLGMLAVDRRIMNTVGLSDGEFGARLNAALSKMDAGRRTTLAARLAGKTNVLAFLDTSTHLFEDHRSNGLIGVNGDLFDDGLSLDQVFISLAVGLAHELEHEALSEDADHEGAETGFVKLDEAFTRTLLGDDPRTIDAYAEALAGLSGPSPYLDALSPAAAVWRSLKSHPRAAGSRETILRAVETARALLEGNRFPSGRSYFHDALMPAAKAAEAGAGPEAVVAALFRRLDDPAVGRRRSEALDSLTGKDFASRVAGLLERFDRVDGLPFAFGVLGNDLDESDPDFLRAVQDHSDLIQKLLGKDMPLDLFKVLCAHKMFALETVAPPGGLAKDAPEDWTYMRADVMPYAYLAEEFLEESLSIEMRELTLTPLERERVLSTFLKTYGLTYSEATAEIRRYQRETANFLKSQGIEGKVLVRPSSSGLKSLWSIQTKEAKRAIGDIFGLMVISNDPTAAAKVDAYWSKRGDRDNAKSGPHPASYGYRVSLTLRRDSSKPRKIEILVQNQAGHLAYKNGHARHGVYNVTKIWPHQDFVDRDRPQTETPEERLMHNQESLESVDIVFVGKMKAGRRVFIPIPVPKGRSVSDAVAHSSVDLLGKGYAGVQLVSVRVRDGRLEESTLPQAVPSSLELSSGMFLDVVLASPDDRSQEPLLEILQQKDSLQPRTRLAAELELRRRSTLESLRTVQGRLEAAGRRALFGAAVAPLEQEEEDLAIRAENMGFSGKEELLAWLGALDDQERRAPLADLHWTKAPRLRVHGGIHLFAERPKDRLASEVRARMGAGWSAARVRGELQKSGEALIFPSGKPKEWELQFLLRYARLTALKDIPSVYAWVACLTDAERDPVLARLQEAMRGERPLFMATPPYRPDVQQLVLQSHPEDASLAGDWRERVLDALQKEKMLILPGSGEPDRDGRWTLLVMRIGNEETALNAAIAVKQVPGVSVESMGPVAPEAPFWDNLSQIPIQAEHDRPGLKFHIDQVLKRHGISPVVQVLERQDGNGIAFLLTVHGSPSNVKAAEEELRRLPDVAPKAGRKRRLLLHVEVQDTAQNRDAILELAKELGLDIQGQEDTPEGPLGESRLENGVQRWNVLMEVEAPLLTSLEAIQFAYRERFQEEEKQKTLRVDVSIDRLASLKAPSLKGVLDLAPLFWRGWGLGRFNQQILKRILWKIKDMDLVKRDPIFRVFIRDAFKGVNAMPGAGDARFVTDTIALLKKIPFFLFSWDVLKLIIEAAEGSLSPAAATAHSSTVRDAIKAAGLDKRIQMKDVHILGRMAPSTDSREQLDEDAMVTFVRGARGKVSYLMSETKFDSWAEKEAAGRPGYGVAATALSLFHELAESRGVSHNRLQELGLLEEDLDALYEGGASPAEVLAEVRRRGELALEDATGRKEIYEMLRKLTRLKTMTVELEHSLRLAAREMPVESTDALQALAARYELARVDVGILREAAHASQKSAWRGAYAWGLLIGAKADRQDINSLRLHLTNVIKNSKDAAASIRETVSGYLSALEVLRRGKPADSLAAETEGEVFSVLIAPSDMAVDQMGRMAQQVADLPAHRRARGVAVVAGDDQAWDSLCDALVQRGVPRHLVHRVSESDCRRSADGLIYVEDALARIPQEVSGPLRKDLKSVKVAVLSPVIEDVTTADPDLRDALVLCQLLGGKLVVVSQSIVEDLRKEVLRLIQA